MHPMECLGDVGLMKYHFFLFGDNFTIGASRHRVCAKRIICSEIILDTLDVTPR
jgi:hypothetical protein